MRGNTAPYSTIGAYPLPLGFNGRHGWIYRWFSGRPMNGHRYTDATGFRYGTMALDVSGHATPYQLLPGGLRFVYARLPFMLFLPAVLATWLWPLPMYLLGCALILFITWRVQRWRKRRTFRADVIEPVSAGVAAVLKAKRVSGQGHTWVTVPPGFRDNPDAKITVRLPLDFIGHDGDRQAITRIVAAKLAVDDLTPVWALHGAAPFVTFSQPPAPPDLVEFATSLADAEQAEEGGVMLGYGPRRKVEMFSLLLESPHALVNGGSGAGKSVLLAFIVAQFMRRGYGVVVLDAKFISHMWLRRIPGVHYASESEELHDTLVWLDEEMLRRARLVSRAPDVDKAAADLVPLAIVLEEINGASNRLRAYWKSIKGPDDAAMSPALTALSNLANMGRELRVHLFLAGQSITAKSTGGPEGRESYGARLLGRATSNAWKMLAPQIKPAPVKRGRPGRWHIVVGDTIREFQVPFADLKDPAAVAALSAWAQGGAVVPDVTAMMAGWVGSAAATTADAEGASSGAVAAPEGVSLRLFAEGVGMQLQTFIDWRNRRSDFPSEVAVGANRTKLYDRDHLRAYVRERLREPANADE